MSAEPQISQYLHQIGGRMGLPVSGTFELTPRCNFSCKMCYIHLDGVQAKQRGEELTVDQWLAIAREAKAAGMVFLLLTGGEPFLRPDFVSLYTQLAQMGFLISINSNGSLIRDEVLECLRKYPPVRMNISLYGGSDDAYRSLCGVGAFEEVIHNIDSLLASGIYVSVNVSATPYNADQMEQIFRLTRERKLSVRASAYMNPPVRVDPGKTGSTEHRFTPEAAAECTVQLEKLRLGPENFLRHAQSFVRGDITLEEENCTVRLGEKMRCRAGRSSFWITWDGHMVPCGMMTEPSADVKTLGFLPAWEQIRSASGEIMLPPECSCCVHRNRCFACAAMCQGETGRFDGKPEYICRMIEKQLELEREALEAYAKEEI